MLTTTASLPSYSPAREPLPAHSAKEQLLGHNPPPPATGGYGSGGFGVGGYGA